MPEDPLLDEITNQVGSEQEARWIVDHAWTVLSLERDVAPIAREMAARRAGGEPLQYVLGLWQFREIELIVDERALIPRPETEQVVQGVLDRWRQTRVGQEGLVVVDLGAGTGAIGLSLQHELRNEATIEEVILAERSHDALNLALENTLRLGAERVSVASGSWFEALDPLLRTSVHLLVSNPPYVAVRDRPNLAQELFYEPEEALFSLDSADGTPGFKDVAFLISNARPWMHAGGILGLEMAEIHVEPATQLAQDVGFENVEAIVDLAGKPRGITAIAP